MNKKETLGLAIHTYHASLVLNLCSCHSMVWVVNCQPVTTGA